MTVPPALGSQVKCGVLTLTPKSVGLMRVLIPMSGASQ